MRSVIGQIILRLNNVTRRDCIYLVLKKTGALTMSAPVVGEMVFG